MSKNTKVQAVSPEAEPDPDVLAFRAQFDERVSRSPASVIGRGRQGLEPERHRTPQGAMVGRIRHMEPPRLERETVRLLLGRSHSHESSLGRTGNG